MNNDETYTPCTSCGRPMAYCKGQCCGKTKGCQCKEYCGKVCGAIRPGEPKCPPQAVIPSLTVESVSNLKDLADCFVHVSDINTTFYIDDKHRIMTTWAGLVSVDDYDFAANPLNLRGQIAYDAKNNVAAIYDKQGANYIFQISDINNDYMLLQNKPQINGVTLEGNKTSADLGIPDIDEVALVFDTVTDMKAATDLVDGGYARTLGFHSVNDGGGALYKISDSGTANEMDIISVSALKAHLVEGTSAKQFGAYGDGTHDDSAAIQRAIDSNGHVTIPAGTYLVSTITISEANSSIEGNGCVIKSIDSNSESAIIQVENDGVNGIAISGITVDGNKQSNSNDIDGIRLTRNVYADCFGRLENVTVLNCTGNGISVSANSDALIREMKFINIRSHHNDKNGLFANTMTDSFITLSVFDNNKLNGIYIGNSGSIKISQVKCYWNGINSSEDIDVDRLEAGEMIVTSDATPQAGKTYYTRTGTGNWQDSYKYTKYTGSSFGGDTYYEVKSANYKSRSHGIYVDNSSVILITNSEMQANAGDGIHFTTAYNINISNTSLDNNGYYFDENYQAYSYASLGIKPFYAGIYCNNCKYIYVNATTLNAFYNYQGISQAYGACLKNSTQNKVDIVSRLQTAPVQLLNLKPEDVFVQVNGNLLPIDMDLSYNITNIPSGYELYSTGNTVSKLQLIGSKIKFTLYFYNENGFGTSSFNLCEFIAGVRPKHQVFLNYASMAQYYAGFNNGANVIAAFITTAGRLSFQQAGSSQKYANIQGEFELVQS